ncbi:MAG: hypothetical protein V1790_12720 [Planctomycetota bacterium]
MTVEQLRNVHQAKPFHPYTLKVADGSRIAVRHPEFLSVSPVGRTVIVWQPDGSFEVLDLLLVASILVQDGKTRARRP